MVWNEIPEQKIIEPVEIESVRSYLGYADGRHEEDDLLTAMIRSARSRLEDRLGRAIARRTFVKHVYSDGMHGLIPSLIGVLGIAYADTQGNPIKMDGKSYRAMTGDTARVFFTRPADADISEGYFITFESGFIVCPESIKLAILKMCRMDKDRSAEDAIDTVWADIQAYRIENI